MVAGVWFSRRDRVEIGSSDVNAIVSCSIEGMSAGNNWIVKWRNISLYGFAVLCLARRLVSQDVGSRLQQLRSEARAEESQGRLDSAIQKYQQILRLNPNLAPAHNNLGKLY